MVFIERCARCENKHSIELLFDDFLEYKNTDKLIQEVFPDVSSDGREIIMINACRLKGFPGFFFCDPCLERDG